MVAAQEPREKQLVGFVGLTMTGLGSNDWRLQEVGRCPSSYARLVETTRQIVGFMGITVDIWDDSSLDLHPRLVTRHHFDDLNYSNILYMYNVFW